MSLRRLMMAGASAPPVTGYAAALLALSPKFAWFMNEASGSLVDRTGNGRSATAVGTPQYGQASLLPNGEGGSVYFSGDDYFTASGAMLGPFSAGWFSVWLKKNFTSPYRIIYGENLVGNSNSFVTYLAPDSQSNIIVSNRYNSSWPANLNSSPPANPTNAMLMVLTGDASGRQIYIDGVLKGSDSIPWQSQSTTEAHLGRAAGDPNFWTGWLQYAAGGNRKLSAAEVTALYAARV